MGWVRRDWTWNKADLGSYLPTSSLDRQLLHIYLVPDSAVNTQRFALSLFSFSQSTVQVSNLQARIGTSCQINGSIRLDIKCTINAICLNHSETISPLLVLGKIVFHEIGESESHSVMSNSLQPHGLYSPWNSPGQNTGVGSLFLSPGALPNPGIEPRSPALQVESLPAEPKKVGNHCPNGHNSENYTSSPDCSLSF